MALNKEKVPAQTGGEKHLHDGHRKRMRDRALKNGVAEMSEVDLLEMMLYYVVPRADTRKTAEELDAMTLDPDFWNNQENSSKVLQQIKRTKDKIEEYDALCARLEDAITLAEIAIEENEEGYIPEVMTELAEITAEEEKQIMKGEMTVEEAVSKITEKYFLPCSMHSFL